MPSLTTLTKKQLIDIIQQQEEYKYAVLKEEFGLPYQTDEEWIEYIARLQKNSKKVSAAVCEELERLRQSASRCY